MTLVLILPVFFYSIFSYPAQERFVDLVVAPVLFTYQHLGLWCAIRHIVMFCEGNCTVSLYSLTNLQANAQHGLLHEDLFKTRYTRK